MNDEFALEGIAALANKSRWEIFWFLVDEEGDDTSAGKISKRLNIAPATLSFHLKQLTQAKLLKPTRCGNQIFYSPDRETVSQIANYIEENALAKRRRENRLTTNYLIN